MRLPDLSGARLRAALAITLVASVLLSGGMAAVTAHGTRLSEPPAADAVDPLDPSPPAAMALPETPAAGEAAPETAPPAEPLVLEGTLSEYFIYLPQLTGPAGTVRFVVQNTGERRHNLRIAGNGVDKVTPELRAGQTGEVEVFFVDPGPYTVYCDLGDHADRGMTTSFYVEPPFTQP